MIVGAALATVFLTQELVSILWPSFTDETLAIFCLNLLYRFPRSFLLSVFCIGKTPFLDDRICRCHVNNVCCTLYLFVWVYIDHIQLNSITNYIISLLKAIYSVLFSFAYAHFWKIYQKLNGETLTFSSHQFRVCCIWKTVLSTWVALA